MAKKKKRPSKTKGLSDFTRDLIIVDKVMSPRNLLWALLIISLLANLAVGIALHNS